MDGLLGTNTFSWLRSRKSLEYHSSYQAWSRRWPPRFYSQRSSESADELWVKIYLEKKLSSFLLKKRGQPGTFEQEHIRDSSSRRSHLARMRCCVVLGWSHACSAGDSLLCFINRSLFPTRCGLEERARGDQSITVLAQSGMGSACVLSFSHPAG